MAKKGTKLQVVDLGTHFVKAALCEVGDGPVTISKAAAVPLQGTATDADGYIGELSVAFDQLADFFDRKLPVHFLTNESIIHVGISYLNNLPTDQIESAIEADRQKFVSAAGSGVYDVSVHRSFRLREKAQNKNKQVVLANAYAKIEHLDSIYDLCTAKKLTWGGIHPRLFAYSELFKNGYGSEAEASAVACLVDVGYKSTSIIAFKDANIVFHKVLHLGAYQLYQELYNVDPKLQLDLFTLVAIMSQHGFSESEETLTSLGLPLPEPAKYLEVITGEKDQLFTKVQLSIDYFSTVAATDFNTSMSTVMAVRKGPEKILFTGGLSASPGFSDAAAQYFAASELVDPARVCTMGSNSTKTDLPPHFFVLCAAGAQLAATAPAEYNMGDRYKGKSSRPNSPGASAGGGGGGGGASEQFVPTWCFLVALLVMGGIGYMWYDLKAKVKNLNAEFEAADKEVDKGHTLIGEYRDQRQAEASMRVRIEYADELMKNRVVWSKIWSDIVDAIPEGTKVYRLSVDTNLPTGSEGAADPSNPSKGNTPKQVNFRLCGEALKRENVAQFVANLENSKHFVRISAPDMVQVQEGNATSASCTDPEATGVEFLRHFAFQISGSVTY